jgi:hypothetical protein
MLMQPVFDEVSTPSVAFEFEVAEKAVAGVVESMLVVELFRTIFVQSDAAEVASAASVPVVPQVAGIVSMIDKSPRPEPAAVDVSAIEPPFAANVFAVTPVGTAVISEVIVAPPDRPCAKVAELVSFVTTSRRTKAPAVVVSPTTVSEVCPVGPTDATRLVTAAEAGATDDNRPKPKAATVTSATRLKVVFVDICFLSISRAREFLPFGLKLKFLTSFSMNRTC